MGETSSIRAKYYLGAVPVFPFPHLMVEALLPGPQSAWPDLRRRSARVAARIAGAVPNGAKLAQAAVLVEADESGSDPLSAWLAAMENVFEVPPRARTAEIEGDRLVRLRLASPYEKASWHWARIGVALLTHAAESVEKGEIQLDLASWRDNVVQMAAHVPNVPVMHLHAALDARRLPWRWRGEDHTHVGYGSRQKQLIGVPSSSAKIEQVLAGLDAMIPIYTVTGSLGKTSTTRLLAQLLEPSGVRLGMTTSLGAWAGDSRIAEGDCIHGGFALKILSRSDVDAAVLELGRGGLVGVGLPMPSTDVAIMLNVLPIHLGADGIETVEEMASVKALTLNPARLAVLNWADEACRAIGATRAAESCIWFDTRADGDRLARLSGAAAGAVGVARDGGGEPVALTLWEGGRQVRALSLEGVAPYQGMLGEMTLVELAAAAAAAWFGPIPVADWEAILPRLRLDGGNNAFRTSVHRRGNALFVLDKGFGPAVFPLIEDMIGRLCAKNGIRRRILVIARSALRPPSVHAETCAHFHRYMDEFVCFDRPDVYAQKNALPIYEKGDVAALLAGEFHRLNGEARVDRPVHLAGSWSEAEEYLGRRLDDGGEPVLVYVNQPSTDAVDLNRQILAFVGAEVQPFAVPA